MVSTPHHLPNFFLVGAPKAGTTSLYHYLAQHPDIYMSPIKEPCHFSTEVRPENFSHEMRAGVEAAFREQRKYLQGPMTEQRFGGVGMDWDDYVKLFRNVRTETAIGEASVSYLWSKTAATNIHAKIPHAKVVVVLRDPVSRAFSEYLEILAAGKLRCSFREYIGACLSWKTDKISLWWPILEAGLYYESVKRYLDRFPREKVCILLYDNYRVQPGSTIAEIFRFLSVDSSFTSDLSRRHNEPRVPRFNSMSRFLKKRGAFDRLATLVPSKLKPPLRKLAVRPRERVAVTSSDRRFLLGYYRDDIGKLAQLLNRDLTTWLR
jgi:Sulfotransferase family